MPQVIHISDSFLWPADPNSIVVEIEKFPVTEAARAENFDAIEAAKASADRNGVPTVYIVYR
jgi:hypothetical protein